MYLTYYTQGECLLNIFHLKLSLTLYFISITSSTPITSIKMYSCNTTWHNNTTQTYLPNYKRKGHNTICDSSYGLELICEMGTSERLKILHAYALITYTQRDLFYSSLLGNCPWPSCPFLFNYLLLFYPLLITLINERVHFHA